MKTKICLHTNASTHRRARVTESFLHLFYLAGSLFKNQKRRRCHRTLGFCAFSDSNKLRDTRASACQRLWDSLKNDKSLKISQLINQRAICYYCSRLPPVKINLSVLFLPHSLCRSVTCHLTAICMLQYPSCIIIAWNPDSRVAVWAVSRQRQRHSLHFNSQSCKEWS